MSMAKEFSFLFSRELGRLAAEISAYPDDAGLWSVQGDQKNPPGNLALHVAGNLEWYVGVGLGGTGYTRDRDAEFTARGLSRGEVAARVIRCRDHVVPIVGALDDAAFSAEHPGEVPERMRGITTHQFLVHLLWHVGWHTGQVYYHRLGLGVDPR